RGDGGLVAVTRWLACGDVAAPQQAAVADHVGGQDRRQLALLMGHGKSPRSRHRSVGGSIRLGNQSVGTGMSLQADMSLANDRTPLVMARNDARLSWVFRSGATGSAPSAPSFVCNVGSASATTAAAFNRATIGSGVAAGKNKAIQFDASKSFR